VREHIITKKGEGYVISRILGGLGQKGTEGNPKVIIVPFLYFIS